MPRARDEMVEARDRRQWRAWLEKHHASAPAVWLVFHKRHTEKPCIGYEAAVEEAICFGWVDSLVKRIDDDRYARKFTPRKPDSRWSTINRRRYEKVKARGLLAPAGLERAPTERSGDAPKVSTSSIPRYIERALRANPRAWNHFRQLAPSYKAAYVGWIDSAKREETKQRRLREALERLASGRKLGMR